VNAFTACQLNILFMQHWFQYILYHHMGVVGDLFHLSGGTAVILRLEIVGAETNTNVGLVYVGADPV